MAECIDIQAELSAYLDGELAAPERSALDAHLATCGVCQAALEELRSVASAMSDLPRATAPASLMANVRRDIANEPALREQARAAVAFSSVERAGNRPRAHWAPFAFGMAALVLLCLLAFLILPAISSRDDSVAVQSPAMRVPEDSAKEADPNSVRTKDEEAATLADKSLPAQDRAAGYAAKPDDAVRKRGAERQSLDSAPAPAIAPNAPPAPATPLPAPTAKKAAPGNVAELGAPAESRRREQLLKKEEAAEGDPGLALRRELEERQKSVGAALEKKKSNTAVGGEARDAVEAGADKAKAFGGGGAPAPRSAGIPPAPKPAAEPAKPGEFKGGAREARPADAAAAKIAGDKLQQAQQEAESLARRRLEDQSKNATPLPQEKAAVAGSLAAQRDAKDEKLAEKKLEKAGESLHPDAAPGAAQGVGPARGAVADDGRVRKAEPETVNVPRAAKTAVLALKQADSGTIVIRTRNLQRTVSDLKQLVEASGARWEDGVVGNGKADADAGQSKKDGRIENASRFEAVTSADQRDGLLAKLRLYETAQSQKGQNAFAAVEEARKETATAEIPAKVKKVEPQGGDADPFDNKTKSRAESKPAPAATAAAPADAGKGAPEARIQIRIEILAE